MPVDWEDFKTSGSFITTKDLTFMLWDSPRAALKREQGYIWSITPYQISRVPLQPPGKNPELP